MRPERTSSEGDELPIPDVDEGVGDDVGVGVGEADVVGEPVSDGLMLGDGEVVGDGELDAVVNDVTEGDGDDEGVTSLTSHRGGRPSIDSALTSSFVESVDSGIVAVEESDALAGGALIAEIAMAKQATAETPKRECALVGRRR